MAVMVISAGHPVRETNKDILCSELFTILIEIEQSEWK